MSPPRTRTRPTMRCCARNDTNVWTGSISYRPATGITTLFATRVSALESSVAFASDADVPSRSEPSATESLSRLGHRAAERGYEQHARRVCPGATPTRVNLASSGARRMRSSNPFKQHRQSWRQSASLRRESLNECLARQVAVCVGANGVVTEADAIAVTRVAVALLPRYVAGPCRRGRRSNEAEPEFAARVRRLFEAGRHKTIATLRADGSPRISGIECEFVDGELRFGSMTGARKGSDLKRNPHFALHGPTFHPEEGKESEWPGEAKIAGRAIPAGPVTTDEASEQPDGEMFVADITEVVITGLNAEATKLVVESWTPERGLRRIERD